MLFSRYWQGLTHTFPVTSDVWWTVETILIILVLLIFAVGESLWGVGVRNFVAYTYYIRYSTQHRHWLLVLIAAAVLAFGIFFFIHFIFGKGYKVGPNL